LGLRAGDYADVAGAACIRRLRLWWEARLSLRGVSRATAPQYRRVVSGGSFPESSQTEQVRALIPVFALAVAIVAAVTDASSAADLILAGLAVGAFVVWTYVPGVPLLALSLAVVFPVVVAQRPGSSSHSCSRCLCSPSSSGARPRRLGRP
jgi:hypothetical protein